MGMIYYKQLIPGVLTFFIVNPITRNVEGMFRECKTNDIISIIRNVNTKAWADIDNNELAKNLIENSIQISQEEYEAAEFIMKAMIETDYWFLSEDKVELDNPIKEKELTTETVFC